MKKISTQKFEQRIRERVRQQNEAVARWNRQNPNALKNSRTLEVAA